MSSPFVGVAEIVKREMVLFFMIDQSGSMYGTKIGTVNNAIREVIPELKGIGGADVTLKIAVLLFSTGVQWMYPEPILVDDFVWATVEAQGVTEFGAACSELCDKMSKNTFLKSTSGSVAPAIFLMSDGQPTDMYSAGLEKLKKNRWFQHSIRVAVAIGDDADEGVLAEFTGADEAVLRVHNPEALLKMIRFITITSSQIGSKSQASIASGGSSTKQTTMIQSMQSFVKDNNIDQNALDDWD
jgi:uncharacterized protein YegL